MANEKMNVWAAVCWLIVIVSLWINMVVMVTDIVFTLDPWAAFFYIPLAAFAGMLIAAGFSER